MIATTTSSAFNVVDYFFLFTFGLSMLAGYMRGFLKEAVSLITWVAAAVLSTLFAGKLAAMFSGSAQGAVESVSGGAASNMGVPMSMLSIGVSYASIFIATLFIGYIVGTLVTTVGRSGSFRMWRTRSRSSTRARVRSPRGSREFDESFSGSLVWWGPRLCDRHRSDVYCRLDADGGSAEMAAVRVC